MALSLYTSESGMVSNNAMVKANNNLTQAMKRLGTGLRINSAADDAAGLQIAARLQAQSNGMAVAKRNIADATALLQTAEGAFEEVTNILYRMKDLSTQAANGTNTEKDLDALQAEFSELGDELANILDNTRYGGQEMFTPGGMLHSPITFQIGASAGETMTLDLNSTASRAVASTETPAPAPTGALDNLITLLKDTIGKGQINISAAVVPPPGGSENDVPALARAGNENASEMIETIADALDEVGALRAKFGASINRLDHTANNLSNMKDNTDVAIGTIRDADYASEVTKMSINSMLMQTSMSMLKQSNSMSSLVMSLVS